MGWVVLSLRKKELKRTHADLQMRDLQIGREKRQLLREKSYQQSVVKGEQSSELRVFKDQYNSMRNNLRDQISVLRNSDQESDADSSIRISELQEELQQAQIDYTDNCNETKSFYETELEMIETESNDIETMYDEEQTVVEAEMQAVAEEIQSVSDAISTEIQNSTIKLS